MTPVVAGICRPEQWREVQEQTGRKAFSAKKHSSPEPQMLTPRMNFQPWVLAETEAHVVADGLAGQLGQAYNLAAAPGVGHYEVAHPGVVD